MRKRAAIRMGAIVTFAVLAVLAAASDNGTVPTGLTMKAPDNETIVDYITSMDGFETFVNNEGRLWVFRTGSAALEQFCKTGKPEKHVTLVGAGPLGITIKAPDRETANAYLRVYARSL